MVKPMDVKEIERLMSNFKPTPELDEIFGRALTVDDLSIGEMERLVKAGYVTDDGKEYNITKPARDYAWENLPEQANAFKAKVDAIEAKARKQREREKAKRDRQYDADTAREFVEQGLLTIRDGRYYNTAEGCKQAYLELRNNINKALGEKHDFYFRNYSDELRSHSGEYEGVPVSQPWRRRNNVLVIKSGFKFIKKKIIESLSDDELELFGRPPRDNKLNKPASEAKAKLVGALTKFRDGSVPNLVATTGSAKRRE